MDRAECSATILLEISHILGNHQSETQPKI